MTLSPAVKSGACSISVDIRTCLPNLMSDIKRGCSQVGSGGFLRINPDMPPVRAGRISSALCKCNAQESALWNQCDVITHELPDASCTTGINSTIGTTSRSRNRGRSREPAAAREPASIRSELYACLRISLGHGALRWEVCRNQVSAEDASVTEWEAIAYIHDMEYGRGTGSDALAAKDAAAQKALEELKKAFSSRKKPRPCAGRTVVSVKGLRAKEI